uniref:Uncharacterized protein n=1 Tax=Rhizophora mucronata TaxID=61149 RepID=A0A2P2PTN8_RHIMU
MFMQNFRLIVVNCKAILTS